MTEETDLIFFVLDEVATALAVTSVVAAIA